MDVDQLTSALERLDVAQTLAEVQEILRSAAGRWCLPTGPPSCLPREQCFYADEDAMSPLWKGQRFPISQ